MKMGKSGWTIVIMLILVLFLAGCNSNPEPQSEVEKIVISQSGAGDQEFTVDQLKEYDSVSADVEAVNSSGDVNPFSLKGARLADVLMDMDLQQAELDAIRLIAGDGYSIEVGSEVLKTRDIILAYEIDGEPLLEDTRPIRAIIPEERAMYWVRNLVKIEIIVSEPVVEVTEVTVIESAAGSLPENEYLLGGEMQKGVKTSDLVVWEGDADPRIHLLSIDGLGKNETWDIFSKGQIVWTGSEAPAFVGEDIPAGMHVKEIFWFTAEHRGFFSLVRANEKLEAQTVEDQTGVLLSAVLNEIGFKDQVGIRLTADDGYSVDIGQGDIAKGLLYMDDEGRACAVFAGLPKSTGIKGLLKIEVLE